LDTVANALSRLYIDSLKIQDNKEEVLILLSGSENSSIINIKLTIPIHTALIFKEQAKSRIQDQETSAYFNLITKYKILKHIFALLLS
jgi:hypothetical protein